MSFDRWCCFDSSWPAETAVADTIATQGLSWQDRQKLRARFMSLISRLTKDIEGTTWAFFYALAVTWMIRSWPHPPTELDHVTFWDNLEPRKPGNHAEIISVMVTLEPSTHPPAPPGSLVWPLSKWKMDTTYFNDLILMFDVPQTVGEINS